MTLELSVRKHTPQVRLPNQRRFCGRHTPAGGACLTIVRRPMSWCSFHTQPVHSAHQRLRWHDAFMLSRRIEAQCTQQHYSTSISLCTHILVWGEVFFLLSPFVGAARRCAPGMNSALFLGDTRIPPLLYTEALSPFRSLSFSQLCSTAAMLHASARAFI